MYSNDWMALSAKSFQLISGWIRVNLLNGLIGFSPRQRDHILWRSSAKLKRKSKRTSEPQVHYERQPRHDQACAKHHCLMGMQCNKESKPQYFMAKKEASPALCCDQIDLSKWPTPQQNLNTPENEAAPISRWEHSSRNHSRQDNYKQNNSIYGISRRDNYRWNNYSEKKNLN